MGTDALFDASLPTPYKENWRESYRADSGESPRLATYQAPGKDAIPFIQNSFRFSGGHSKDTAEYPFGGLWSNEYLNEKPQTLTVEGYLRGPTYITLRNALIEALRIPTDDDNPGYIDLPFWGRFPVVIDDNYEVAEKADEQGQCSFSISFVRAGVSIAERLETLPPADAQLESAVENLEAAAIDGFETSLIDMDNVTFAQAFGQIKNTLLSILGKVQGKITMLNAMNGEILGVMSLINQGIRLPREIAMASFNAVASIVAGIQEIKNSIVMYGRESTNSSTSTPSLPLPDNERNTAILFLSAGTYTLPVETATVSQENTKNAIENLYRIMSFLTAVRIITNMDSVTYKNAGGYWRLLEKLEESINRDNPAVYAAVMDVRIALSRVLSGRELSKEMKRHISIAAPLLYLAHYLGCDEDKIRELNSIADSFVVKGNVIYV